jgi:flagellar hook-basal body complex protein FliE
MAVQAIRDYTGRGEIGSSRVEVSPQARAGSGAEIGGGSDKSFMDLINDFTGDVNNLQFQAGHAIDTMVSGEAADVHQVMVAVEQAGIALDLMLEVRNKVLEGYQELMRMQV